MSETSQNITQTQRFSDELQKLRVDVTAADRDIAMEELSIKAKSTISTYLNGIVRDNDTAAKLIAIFKRLIAERNKVLAA